MFGVKPLASAVVRTPSPLRREPGRQHRDRVGDRELLAVAAGPRADLGERLRGEREVGGVGLLVGLDVEVEVVHVERGDHGLDLRGHRARRRALGAEVGAVGVDRVAAEGDADVAALGLQGGDLRLPAGLVRQRPLAAGAVDEGQGEELGSVVGRDGGERGVAQAGVDVRGEHVRGPGGGRPRVVRVT